ncbi:RsfA family transcriptional regulator [Aquibacillus sp. 3ASR75-11]|uniref:RsfA family transcriptional regulator n=1 Tax=Terrihalobacillus insolitus TaxID=2950438 RepID=A0A9X3WRW3_9BACI|nr:RsfA family transcriptional regulator [Terrihalobacillus insolitus]MDC3412820.1 RsfA family transcriptional regulator [Terrihalobacillus insolitus]MDC3423703.1 RsfA family transcriptional regulator [Terrihalobacillus insolitus]
MNHTRQDAWTEDEDILLAETVLRHIREGKTQLEAFKEVAKKLSRTSAACGFRWNATIRKQYQKAVQLAKQERKQGEKQLLEDTTHAPKETHTEHNPLETAISLLEQMKIDSSSSKPMNSNEDQLQDLKKEIQELKEQLNRYHAAWKEMGQLWDWVESSHKDDSKQEAN